MYSTVWTSAKVKTVNEDVWIQALVDGKKVIVNEASIRHYLRLDDAEGAACLPNDTIFEELARMGAKTTAWNEFSRTMASAIICLANNQKFNFSKYIFESMLKNLEGGVNFLMYLRFIQVFVNVQLGDMSHHKRIFVNSSHTKKIFANMKRAGKDYSEVVTPLFETMMVQAAEEKKQKSRRKQRKETDVPQDEAEHEDSIPTTSNDPLPSGEDRLQLTELMTLCTKLQKQVLDLEEAKTAQAKEIASRVESSKDMASLGDQEDASKQGRMIDNIDQDVEIALVNEAQGMMDDQNIFGFNDLYGDEVIVDVSAGEKEEQVEKVAEMEVSTAEPVSTAGEVVTTANVEVGDAFTTITTTDVDDELTLAKTLIAIKAAKPKVIQLLLQPLLLLLPQGPRLKEL
ncbi:hypothetical protein Tco_1146888 [Tanacetum coccineum]